MSAPLALVQLLLTPNLRAGLPFAIMLLMVQGIHPEIIFNLIPYVSMSGQQYQAIMMAWTQLRLFASILPAVKGIQHQSFRGKRELTKTFPNDVVSRVFAKFQNEVLSIMLTQCGFAGPLPSFEIVRRLGLNLAVVKATHSNMFPIASLFFVSNPRLILMKTVLEMQAMIENVRLFNPDIVSFLKQNKNALMNIIMVWKNQVIVKQVLYGVSYNRHGSLYDIREYVKMNQLFAFLIIAVIDPEFDQSLAQIIANCGYPSGPLQNIQEHSQFLKDHCQLIEPMIFGHFLDISQVLDWFSSMETSNERSFRVRYALRSWSMAFGRIVPFDHPAFEEVTIEQESWVPIFDVFSTFWRAFFLNFSRSFDQSFLPFGNIPWSEGYTRLIQTKFDWIIRIVVGNFAFRIGVLDAHAFFKRETPNYKHTNITSNSYGTYIFPDGIRNAKISEEICSCFLRDFWRAHRKPDPNMSDIDYLRWLFSIPGTFAIFGKSCIELMDDLQNGTKLSKFRDGSSGDFTYLSCPTVPTDPKVQQEYDRIFGGRDPQISDFFDESKK